MIGFVFAGDRRTSESVERWLSELGADTVWPGTWHPHLNDRAWPTMHLMYLEFDEHQGPGPALGVYLQLVSMSPHSRTRFDILNQCRPLKPPRTNVT